MISQEKNSGSAADVPIVTDRAHPVTLREVAEAAGVSTATVSLVINKKKNARIADDTRQRVLEAIQLLGYRPNAIGSAFWKPSSSWATGPMR